MASSEPGTAPEQKRQPRSKLQKLYMRKRTTITEGYEIVFEILRATWQFLGEKEVIVNIYENPLLKEAYEDSPNPHVSRTPTVIIGKAVTLFRQRHMNRWLA
jgi:hypothetical protein